MLASKVAPSKFVCSARVLGVSFLLPTMFHVTCRYGDTCWGLIPKKSSHRLCGCNSGGWEGYGIYYGGYKKNNDGCGGQGGGFAGPKKNNQQKGNLDSVGLIIKIHPL